jgi:hypothetical protein
MRPGGDWGSWPEPPQLLEPQQPEERAEGARDCGAALGAADASGSRGVRVSPPTSETGVTAGEEAGAEDFGVGATAGTGELISQQAQGRSTKQGLKLGAQAGPFQ